MSITINGTENLLDAFSKLSRKEMKKVHKEVLNKVGGILQNEARKNLRKTVKRKTTLIKGITKKVWKSGEGLTVTIMGDYRLKWLEKGTRQRFTKRKKRYKNKKYTGIIRGKYFFRKAINSKQKDVENEINSNLEKSINKIWNKKLN